MLTNRHTSVLSLEENADFTRILNTKYAAFLDGRTFKISETVDPSTADLVLTLSNATGTFYYPVSGRIAYKEQDMSPKEGILFLLDYIDYYFDEYFKSDGDVYLTIDWSKHTFDNVEFQIKGQILNLEAERLGDEFLNRGNQT